MPKLTASNYYSADAERAYMTFSWFKNFMKCEAKTLHDLNALDDTENNATPLLVGNYVHSWAESDETHVKYIDEKKRFIFKSTKATKKQIENGDYYEEENEDGEVKRLHLTNDKYSDFETADQIIETLKKDQGFNGLYQGDKEVIVTGMIGDIVWKGKIDCLNLEKGYFVDLKTVNDFHKKHWNTEQRQWVTFIKDRGYYMQMAIYRELIKQTFGVDCEPLMFAVSKQTPPDKAAIKFDTEQSEQELDYAMQTIYDNQHHFEAVLNGEEKPTRCGQCDYCRATNQVTTFIDPTDLID